MSVIVVIRKRPPGWKVSSGTGYGLVRSGDAPATLVAPRPGPAARSGGHRLSRVETSPAPVKPAQLALHQVEDLADQLVQPLLRQRPLVELGQLAVNLLLLPDVEE